MHTQTQHNALMISMTWHFKNPRQNLYRRFRCQEWRCDIINTGKTPTSELPSKKKKKKSGEINLKQNSCRKSLSWSKKSCLQMCTELYVMYKFMPKLLKETVITTLLLGYRNIHFVCPSKARRESTHLAVINSVIFVSFSCCML